MTKETEDLFYRDIKHLLIDARKDTYRKINFLMVETYWEIGRRIVEQEQKGQGRAGYGEYLITELSKYLGDTIGRGFSIANLKNFRQFYLVFRENQKLYTLCRELSWSHIRLIMRINDERAKEFYLTESRREGWSVRTLQRNIKSRYFERFLSNQSSGKDTVDKEANGKLSHIKDPYVLEFLGIPEDLSGKERLLESALIENMQKFLLELGKGFSFIARQFRISSETSHFYIDLVFYNYILKCFVIIDLKTGKLTHQDIGQMDMYVRMFDDLKRSDDDNPTIGIILCTDKDETIVKYSVLQENKHLFASKYRTVLPSEQELQEELDREKWIVSERLSLYEAKKAEQDYE